MIPRTAKSAVGRRILDAFRAAGAVEVAPDILLPAETLLDLYGEDIRARAYVTSDPLQGEMMLRPDFTVPAALASLPEKKQYHAAWILLIARREVTVGMPDHGGRGWGPTHVEHYGWMTDHGYEPSEWEREQLHAAQDETTTSKENTDD